MNSTHPSEIVLIGGGHSHVLVMRMLGMKPDSNVKTTLISPTIMTPYSGMLPGHIAGLYSEDDCHIDLLQVSNFSNTTFIQDEVHHINTTEKLILTKNHPPISYDYASVDIGSSPKLGEIEGKEYLTPIKPVSNFLQVWNRLLLYANQSKPKDFNVGIIGAGAGGTEVSLAVLTRLQKLGLMPKVFIINRGSEVLSNHNPATRKIIKKELENRGISIHLNEKVIRVMGDAKTEFGVKEILCESGLKLQANCIIIITEPSPQSWLTNSGLTLDNKGFILVHPTLESISHPGIFAAGDIATIQKHPRAKTGVYAVRHGKPLYTNLLNKVYNKKLINYKPQKDYLILLSTGDERAIASRGKIGVGPFQFLWKWKDSIDTKFMSKVKIFPTVMKTSTMETEEESMRCSGCAAKINSDILNSVLDTITPKKILEDSNKSKIILGLLDKRDSSIIQLPKDNLLVQTVDLLPSILKDHYLSGQITANHCLNDLYALHAIPDSVLATIMLPYNSEQKQTEILQHILLGILKVLNQENIVLLGGHTGESKKVLIGLTCNGLLDNITTTKPKLLEGDAFILTKPLGTGHLFSEEMRNRTKGTWIENAIQSMLLSNLTASKILKKYGAKITTDISGFGLVGHLSSLLKNSSMGAILDSRTIPLLEGILELSKLTNPNYSTLYPFNYRTFSKSILNKPSDLPAWYTTLFDPQTSGGLLACIPNEQSKACVDELQKKGYVFSSIIGYIQKEQGIALTPTK